MADLVDWYAVILAISNHVKNIIVGNKTNGVHNIHDARGTGTRGRQIYKAQKIHI